ncbi:MAG: hypothetical protein WCI75_19445 [candidate division NC10 bacterium]
MRYWVYDERTQQALGPYFIMRFKTLYGFCPESKVAPSGAKSKKDWLKAKDVPEFQLLLQELAKKQEAEKTPEVEGQQAPDNKLEPGPGSF